MPIFSASTCLTNAGTTPLGPVLSAYTDTDSYLNPFASVLLTQITGSSCPYVFTNIPPGTTNIRLIDPTNSCCITIPIQSDNFCNTCDLGFNYYPLITDSEILAGDITGSCQGSFSDYVVHWYGPNSSTNIAYRTGKGSAFSSLYNFTHPLTGSSFLFAQSGLYTPVIDRIKISGYTFVNTGGTGVYDATLDCFNDQQVQVRPLFCGSGNTPNNKYTHSYYFSGTGASAVPLNVTFQLSANTNYFAYSFTGVNVPDRLIIKYSGGTTPSELILENMSVGTQNTAASYPWSAPRTANVSVFSKVFCLTGLTRIPGDNLSIQLFPNPGNTEWALNLKCFPSFSCTTCQEQYFNSNTPYKLIKSTITAVTATCATVINYRVSGCNLTELTNTDAYNYFGNGSTTMSTFSLLPGQNSSSGTNNGIIPGTNTTALQGNNSDINLSFSSIRCANVSYGILSNPASYTCFPSPSAGTFTFSKYVTGGTPGTGVIDMTFSTFYWFNYFYTSYTNAINSNSTWGLSSCTATTTSTGTPTFYPGANPGNPTQGPFSGGTTSNNIPSYLDPTDTRYYRAFSLCVPSATGSTFCKRNDLENCPAQNCGFVGNGGGGLMQCYIIHPSAIVTTGITGSNYGIRIVMSKINRNINFDTCVFNCSTHVDTTITAVNLSSTGTSNNVSFTSTAPSLLTNPFTNSSPVFIVNDGVSGTSGSFSANCSTNYRNYSQGLMYNYDYMNITIPQNPSTNLAMLQYSGVTCPRMPRNTSPININGNATDVTTNYLFVYMNELLNEPVNGPLIPPANTAYTQVYKNFNIYTLPITNGTLPGGSPGNILPNLTNPNWVKIYTFRYDVQEFCNSTYIIGC